MSDNLQISISGIRGTRPGSLTDSVVVSAVDAYCEQCSDGPIVLSYDGREGGEEVYELVQKVLTVKGREILDAGCVPLPTTQVAVLHHGASAGICVTASHNPAEYNGLKFLNNEGEFISQEVVDVVRERIAEGDPLKLDSSHKIKITDIKEEAINTHIGLFDIVPIDKKLRVAVDANNASGSEIVPRFLETLGCDVIPLATDQSKSFVHTPEPISANLEWTQSALKELEYDVCVVVDPDADRLVLIDEQGQIVSEEHSVPLVALNNFENGMKDPVVINKSTSMTTEMLAKKYDVPVFRSAVGEKNVIEKMKEVGAVIGGEGSGGIIDGRIHFGRDSLVGIYNVIQLLRKRDVLMSQIVSEMPETFIRKEKYNIPDDGMEAAYGRLRQTFPNATFDTEDGLLITFPETNSWIHVRPSNTEPVMRIIGEALGRAILNNMFDTAVKSVS